MTHAESNGNVGVVGFCFGGGVANPVHALAQMILTVMEGGVMQSRTHRSLEAFDAGVALLRDYLDRLQNAAKEEER